MIYTYTMYYRSKTTSLIILGITALLCSRAMFVFFDDPEGTNLLVTTVMGMIIYIPSLALYMSNHAARAVIRHISLPALTGIARLLATILIQILITTAFYFCLR